MSLKLLPSILFLLTISGIFSLLVLMIIFYAEIDSRPHAGTLVAPDTTTIIQCSTSKGTIRIHLDRIFSPNGVKQLLNMVDAGYMQEIPFFRVNTEITQFGVRERIFKYKSDWTRDENVPKEQRKPWKRGDMAMIGGTHMVIVKKGNSKMGMNNHDTVVGRIPEEDMKVIDSLYAYNDVIDHPSGPPGPDQTNVRLRGWKYLNEEFPKVDKIISCVRAE